MKKFSCFIVVLLLVVVFMGTAEAQKVQRRGTIRQDIVTTNDTVIINGVDCRTNEKFIKNMHSDLNFENLVIDLAKKTTSGPLVGIESGWCEIWLNENPENPFYYKKSKYSAIVNYYVSRTIIAYIDDKLKCEQTRKEQERLITTKQLIEGMFAGHIPTFNQSINNRTTKQGSEESFVAFECFYRYDIPLYINNAKKHPEWPKCGK